MLKVSIIVAVHNGEKTIGECITSLESQSYPRDQYDIIVVDDGSTDATLSVLKKFAVTVIAQPRQGPAAARNAGVAEAGGEIVLFSDADCVADSKWVESMVTPFGNPEIAGARGRYRTLQKSLVARFAQIEYEEKYEQLEAEKYIDFIDTSSAGYRKSVFVAEKGFRSSFSAASGEDTEFAYRLAKRGYKLVLSPEAFVYHRHPATLSHYLSRKFKTAVWRVFLYQSHPDKMIRDSHTPQTLKAQIGCFYLFVGLSLLLPVWSFLVYAWIGTVLAFLAACLPFVVFALQRDAAVALASPALILARSAVFAIGLLAGILKLMSSRMSRTGQASAC